jgi:hypothetical protein
MVWRKISDAFSETFSVPVHGMRAKKNLFNTERDLGFRDLRWRKSGCTFLQTSRSYISFSGATQGATRAVNASGN